MNNANDSHSDCNDLLADYETWQGILDPAFRNNTAAADCLAHLLFLLKNAIASGPEGRMRAINTLQVGIGMVWPYTAEHKLAYDLYEIYLSGDLKPWEEPRQVLEGALDRFRAEGRKTRSLGRRRKQRSRRVSQDRS